MTHSVYTCDDFQLESGILTIWGSKEIAKVEDVEGFNRLYDLLHGTYNSLVCPGLYVHPHNQKIEIIIFK